jgi:hypothetical protein
MAELHTAQYRSYLTEYTMCHHYRDRAANVAWGKCRSLGYCEKHMGHTNI